MTEAAYLPLELELGDDCEIVIDGYEYPIDGFTFIGHIVSNSTREVILTFSNTIDVENRITTFSLTAESISEIPFGTQEKFDYYIRQIDTTGFRKKIVKGPVNILL